MGMVLAPTLGPTMGGLAIEYFNWRYVFLLTVPSVALAFILGNLFMPTKALRRRLPRFDFLGFFLMCGALTGFLLGFSNGQRLGWGSGEIIGLFAAGIFGSIGFVLRQIYGAYPLINMKLFLIPQFAAASLVALFTGCAFLSSTFLLPLFVQQIQSYSPLEAGLMMMPGGISLLILFPVAGWLADALPPQLMIYFGLFSFGMAFVFLSGADVNTPFWTLVGFTLLIRAGTAFTRPVINSTALQALPSELVDQGSSAVNFMRQLGAAIGTNGLVVFLEMRIPFHSDAFSGASRFGRDFQAQIARLLTEAGVPEAVRGPGTLNFLADMIYAQASTAGFQDTFLVLAGVSFAGAAPAWLMARRRRR